MPAFVSRRPRSNLTGQVGVLRSGTVVVDVDSGWVPEVVCGGMAPTICLLPPGTPCPSRRSPRSKLSAMRTSCRASWQSPSASVQCRHSDLLYSGMSAGTAATAITSVMPAGVDGVIVDVAAGGSDAVVGVAVDVGGVIVAVGAVVGLVIAGVAAGVGVGVPGGGMGVGSGPMSSPHSVPATDRPVASPSCAAMIASAICPGPPSASMRHCHPARSFGLTPAFGAATSHSSSFRHAIVTKSAVMLAAMALSGSPSIPAVIAFLGVDDFERRPQAGGSFQAERLRTGDEPGNEQLCYGLVFETPDESFLFIPGSRTGACECPGQAIGVVSDAGQFGVRQFGAQCLGILQPEWDQYPRGSAGAVGSGVGELADVSLGAAVGLFVGVSVDVVVGAVPPPFVVRVLGGNAGVAAMVSWAVISPGGRVVAGSEQAIRVAMVKRSRVGRSFSTCGSCGSGSRSIADYIAVRPCSSFVHG